MDGSEDSNATVTVAATTATATVAAATATAAKKTQLTKSCSRKIGNEGSLVSATVLMLVMERMTVVMTVTAIVKAATRRATATVAVATSTAERKTTIH
jgi:hypothetical protein